MTKLIGPPPPECAECMHDWEVHYVDFGGTTGCHEVSGADGEQCICLGYGVARPEPEPRTPYDPSKPLSITNMAAFIPKVWNDEIISRISDKTLRVNDMLRSAGRMPTIEEAVELYCSTPPPADPSAPEDSTASR